MIRHCRLLWQLSHAHRLYLDASRIRCGHRIGERDGLEWENGKSLLWMDCNRYRRWAFVTLPSQCRAANRAVHMRTRAARACQILTRPMLRCRSADLWWRRLGLLFNVETSFARGVERGFDNFNFRRIAFRSNALYHYNAASTSVVCQGDPLTELFYWWIFSVAKSMIVLWSLESRDIVWEKGEYINIGINDYVFKSPFSSCKRFAPL